MMKSLWSGVGGLQAHQIAMDVEGNNIANVNTTGFKYSRTNFSDLLSQTSKIATAPQGELGGKNGVQVGLGVTVATVSHIFSQGSIQNTDKNTDMAIQGDGFFIVSPDGGTTFKYTRSGDFKFDAFGNFTDSNGYIVQGWTRNDETKKIDNTQPVKNIQIDPGLTTPASPTTLINLKANLSAASTVSTTLPTNALDSDSSTSASTIYADKYSLSITSTNQKPEDLGSLFNAQGKAFNLQEGQGIWVSTTPSLATSSSTSSTVALSVSDITIDLTLNGTSIKDTLPAETSSAAIMAANYVDLINRYTDKTGVKASVVSNSDGTGYYITYRNENDLDGDNKKNIELTFSATNTPPAWLGDVDVITNPNSRTAFKYEYATNAEPYKDIAAIYRLNKNPNVFHTTEDLRKLIQWQLGDSASSVSSVGVKVSVNSNGEFQIDNSLGSNTLNLSITSIHGTATSSVAPNTLFANTMAALGGTMTAGAVSTKQSLAINAAVHGSGIDVFDSLGSKHTISFSFRKVSSNTWEWTATAALPADIGGDPYNKNVFKGEGGKPNTITFNEDGSVSNYSPKKLNVTFNNGSSGNQNIDLSWGTSGLFDGLSSYDAASATSLIAQDGYTGGDLQDIRIDQNGVLVGSFTNGISYGLAQVSLAKFSNNEGLMSEGGNIYAMSSNSGAPTVGTASTGGRGSITSSALETSNVDLSRSLTELIVIQRGYQANSKTITTSDQMLQTLLQLKQ